MVAIRNNLNSSMTICYTGGRNGRLDLAPGVNLNVPPSEWQHAVKHPMVKFYLEGNVLEPLTTDPSPDGELEGFDVVDSPKTDEPLPITEAKIGKRPITPKKSEDEKE